jgi:hypothetical protein
MPGDPPMPERPPMAEIADLDAREEMQPHCGAYRSFGCTVDAEYVTPLLQLSTLWPLSRRN